LAKKANVKPGQQMATLRRVLRYIKPQLPALIFSLVMALIAVALTLYIPILIGRAVDCMIGKDNVDMETLAGILTTIAVCVGVTALAQWLQTVVNNRITYFAVR